MTHLVDVGVVVTLGSWVLHVALGIWVLTLAPRRPQTLLLGGFLVLHGLAHLIGGTAFAFDLTWAPVGNPDRNPIYYLEEIASPLSHLLMLALAAVVPRRLEDPRLLGVALGVAGGFAALTFGGFLFADPFPVAQFAYFFLDSTTFWAPVMLLVLRASPDRTQREQDVIQLAIIAIAFAFFAEFISGRNVPFLARAAALGDHGLQVGYASALGFWIVIAGLWARNMVYARPSTARIHRTATLGILGLLLLGAFEGTLLPDAYWGISFAIVNTIGVALLAYGILRHDIAGLDAKVEWGVSKTTVAGAFVAVFFVAGELAETFFGDVLGDYIGIIAAGLLVFAISPLQRLADRIAAKAVPGGAEMGADAEERYRTALEVALADGEVGPGEERRLAELAEELGISHTRALDLREGIEADVVEAGRGGA